MKDILTTITKSITKKTARITDDNILYEELSRAKFDLLSKADFNTVHLAINKYDKELAKDFLRVCEAALSVPQIREEIEKGIKKLKAKPIKPVSVPGGCGAPSWGGLQGGWRRGGC